MTPKHFCLSVFNSYPYTHTSNPFSNMNLISSFAFTMTSSTMLLHIPASSHLRNFSNKILTLPYSLHIFTSPMNLFVYDPLPGNSSPYSCYSKTNCHSIIHICICTVSNKSRDKQQYCYTDEYPI